MATKTPAVRTRTPRTLTQFEIDAQTITKEAKLLGKITTLAATLSGEGISKLSDWIKVQTGETKPVVDPDILN